MPALNWAKTEDGATAEVAEHVSGLDPAGPSVYRIQKSGKLWTVTVDGDNYISHARTLQSGKASAQAHYNSRVPNAEQTESDSGMGWSHAIAELSAGPSAMVEFNWQPFPNAVPDANGHVAQFADVENGRYKIIPPSHNEYPRWVVLHNDEYVGDNKSARSARDRAAVHYCDYKDFAAEEDAELPAYSELSIKQVQSAIDDFRAIPRVVALRREVALFAIQAQEGLIHRLANMRGVPKEYETPNEKLSLKMEYLWQINQFLHGRRGLDGGVFTLKNDGFRFTLKWIPMR